MPFVVLRRLTLTAAAVAIACIGSPIPSAQSLGDRTIDGTFYVRDSAGEMGGAFTNAMDGPNDPSQQSLAGASGAPRIGALRAAAPPYAFFPQAGTQGLDVFVNNYVDLNNSTPGGDITLPGLDYECTGYSYKGHDGHDSAIEGFREQSIGVPVFAALDGKVIEAVDGEFDQQVTNYVPGARANRVTLLHEGGYQTVYLHLKQGSVAVTVGQEVTAGTQLGLTGSSGNSSWPHLHFGSKLNGQAFEPSAGQCRAGASYWVSQPPIRREVHVSTFTYGVGPFSGHAGYPYDEVTRRGTYASGTTDISFRFSIRNLPAQSTYQFVLTRPDGSTAMNNSAGFNNTELRKRSWFWFSRKVTLNTTGEWTLVLFVNGENVATAPFSVVTDSIVNSPPFAVDSVAFDPPAPGPTDVPICRVTPGSLYRRDPDYDLVRYRYRWFLQGALVRDVTSAALSDAIPSGILRAGDQLRCEVTPSDDSLTGPTASVTTGADAQR